jgi:hypothetical protein
MAAPARTPDVRGDQEPPAARAGHDTRGSPATAPTGNTATGTPSRAAAATEAQVPDPQEGQAPALNGYGGNREGQATRPEPTLLAATRRTAASERRARRARRATSGPPPAHQDTEAPARWAAATVATAEPDQDPGAEKRESGDYGETGP